MEADVGSTGCTVQEIPSIGTAAKTFVFSNPEKSGRITITSKVADCGVESEGYIYVQVDDCSKCNGGAGGGGGPMGSGTTENNSVDFKLYLGRANAQAGAGFLWLKADAPSAALAQPASLAVPFPMTEVEVISSGGAISQVKVPQGLVKVVTVSAYEYELRVYFPSAVGAKSGGVYPTTGSPFATWKVKNPDGASANNRLWITESRSGMTDRVSKFTYTTTNLRWDLLEPDATTTTSTWKVVDGSDANKTNYYRQTTAGSTVVQQTRRLLLNRPSVGDVVVLEQAEGDGSLIQTTAYTYYAATGVPTGSANRLRRVDYPDGRWEYHEYDSSGRVNKTYSAYGNNAAPASGSAPAPATIGCRLTEYSYALTVVTDGVDDSGGVSPAVWRKKIEKEPYFNTGSSQWELKEVGRSLRTVTAGTDEVIQETQRFALPVNPGTGNGQLWGATGHQKSIAVAYSRTTVEGSAAPDFDFMIGLPKMDRREDGTASFYTYTKTSTDFTITEQKGEPDSPLYPTAIVNGVQIVTVKDLLGRITSKTVQEISSYGINTTPLLEQQTYTYLSSDPEGRDFEVVDLGNRKTTYTYACCGLESVTDPDGIRTEYDYDSRRREVARLRIYGYSGIKMTNLLDSAGRVLESRRIGTDGSTNILSASGFDVLGRLIAETNALGGVTRIGEAVTSYQLKRSTTNDDGGIVVEQYFRDGDLQSRTGTAAFPVRFERGIERDGVSGPWRRYLKEIKLTAAGSDTSEWKKSYLDGLGREYKTLYNDQSGTYPYSEVTYNDFGLKSKDRDPDGVTTLFQYDGQARLTHTVGDLDLDGVVDLDGTDSRDRVTRKAISVGTYSSTSVWQIDTYVLGAEESDTETLVDTEYRSLNGLKQWRLRPGQNQTTYVLTVYGSGGARTETTTQPDGTWVERTFSYGRLASVTSRNSSGGQLEKVSYQYDSHGRGSQAIDDRNGTTVTTYNAADKATSVTTPAPGNGQGAQVLTQFYNKLGQLNGTLNPDGTTLTNFFYITGLVSNTFGARSYPVTYTYDDQGRLKTMKTWTNFTANTGSAVTTWIYDGYRGFLKEKVDADASTGAAGSAGTGVAYTYTSGGRLKTKKSARMGSNGTQPITTTYLYGFEDTTPVAQEAVKKHGDLVMVSHSNDPQATPDTKLRYDRRGRNVTVIRNGITTTRSYNDANELLGESHAGGTLAGHSVERSYYASTDTHSLKLKDIIAKKSGASVQTTTYEYATSGRLAKVKSTVAANEYSANYTYLANSSLASSVAFKKNTSTSFTTTKNYDNLNRLQAISSAASGKDPFTARSYVYDDANQRSRAYLEDGSYWRYEYDALGQVISGKHYWQDGTPVAGQQHEYRFDSIGNRTETKVGGDSAGANLRGASYAVNRRNQYVSRDVPGAVDVLGLAKNTSSVMVNSTVAYRYGEYFWNAPTVNNSSASQWLSVTLNVGGSPTTKNAFIPKDDETYSHDADGNLLYDGRWDYKWDADNRLVQMALRNSPGGQPLRRLVFEYDWMGRRIRKQVYNAITGGSLLADTKFLYDGWNLTAELNALSSDAAVRTYMWGPDLSGTMTGAGGVGGLLAIVASSTVHFASFDGNGNVTTMVDGTAGNTITARYEYGTFGELIRKTGTISTSNPFRFSTKFQDDESDLLYYGYRYYNAGTGRWISKDPLEEGGGDPNLMAMVGNCATIKIDVLGLYPNSWPPPIPPSKPYWPPPPPPTRTPVCKEGDQQVATGTIVGTIQPNCSTTNFKGKFGVSGTLKVSVSYGLQTAIAKWGAEISVTVSRDYEFDVPPCKKQWLEAGVPIVCKNGDWSVNPLGVFVRRMEADATPECPDTCDACKKK